MPESWFDSSRLNKKQEHEYEKRKLERHPGL